MGKRKRKMQNVVKVDVGDYLSVLVQQTSKDGRRIDQAVHQIPTPAPRNDPPPSTFIPSPAFKDARGPAFPDANEPMDELDSERVGPLSSFTMLSYPDAYTFHSQTPCGSSAKTATKFCGLCWC